MLHKNFFHDFCRLVRLILWRKIQKGLKIVRILDDLKRTKDDLETKISRNVTVTVLSSFRLRFVPKNNLSFLTAFYSPSPTVTVNQHGKRTIQ